MLTHRRQMRRGLFGLGPRLGGHLLLAPLVLGLAGCGAPAALDLSAAPIRNLAVADVQAACLARGGTDETMCACAADRAEALDDTQRGFIIASLWRNQPETDRFRALLDGAGLAEVGFYFALALPECISDESLGAGE